MARTPPAKAPSVIAGTNYPVLKGPKISKAVDDYVTKTAAIKALELECKMAREYILEQVGDSPIAHVGTRMLSINTVAPMPAVPPRRITKDMVGQDLPGRAGKAGYKQLRIQ